jgi:hypothetical protein
MGRVIDKISSAQGRGAKKFCAGGDLTRQPWRWISSNLITAIIHHVIMGFGKVGRLQPAIAAYNHDLADNTKGVSSLPFVAMDSKGAINPIMQLNFFVRRRIFL